MRGSTPTIPHLHPEHVAVRERTARLRLDSLGNGHTDARAVVDNAQKERPEGAGRSSNRADDGKGLRGIHSRRGYAVVRTRRSTGSRQQCLSTRRGSSDCQTQTVDLNQAIGDFDAAETTLRRLESVWERLAALVPQGIAFVGDSPEGIEHEDLCRAFRDLSEGLPPIDGFRIDAEPMRLDDVAQNRLDAQEVGYIEAITDVEAGIAQPGEAIREYRFRFNRARRRVARDRILELIAEIEGHLQSLTSRIDSDREPIVDPEWDELRDALSEIERLAGSSTPRKGRWGELHRHLAWAQGVDLHDIAIHDWPSVLADINAGLYTDTEPMPVTGADLGTLAESRLEGRLSTKLDWAAIDDEGFERLIFNLISNTPGYENPRWLTKTHAPDGGRDLSVERVHIDPLGGTKRQHVIIACKHWLSKSVTPDIVQAALARVPLSEPPPVDVLVIATSGRFTNDAVRVIDQHNNSRLRPEIEPWAESHLEGLLAQRPDLTPPGLRL
ncbi:MAG TPA: restriction endonuclease [Gaiellaceae bacterium]|nr:restriction endonuclease [Gaiellaceae bacterium]